tara:strand:+ start:660 stop:2147 length:1488 start_codon:yes stop_codon:yes gene_type:complete
MDNINVPVFAQAKVEYTKQLIDILYNHIFDGFSSIYNESKKIYVTKTGIPILNIFRKLLENIPIWNNEIIEEETKRIVKVSRCDWLDDLVTAVFISHTRILMSIGPNQNTNKINVSVPKTPNFIHKIYINIARDLWKNPYLYNENVAGHDRQRNMNRVEEIIKLNIETTIRKELPVKEILRGHLDTYENSEKLDIQMILNEIKKNNGEILSTSNNDNDNDNDNNDNDNDNDNNDNDNDNNDNNNDNDDSPKEIPEVFKEKTIDSDNISEPEKVSFVPQKEEYDNVDIVDENKDNNDSSLTDNIYNDPNDPSIDDIKKNTENIVVNDITLPVIDESSKTDIKSPNLTPTSITDANNDVKDITTVNKIDNEQKSQDTKKEDNDVKMFSFDSLYPGMKTFGSVTKEEKPKEEKTSLNTLGSISENESSKEENIDKTIENISQNNDNVLKEVMKLDKKEESIEETETLDNFFNDVKKIASEKDKSIDVDTKETSYTFFD